jgi:hypothetical protein
MAMSTSSPQARIVAVVDPHAGHDAHNVPQHGRGLPAEVTFLYGFPQAGDYSLFVQIKRAGRVETGVFDAHVEKATIEN